MPNLSTYKKILLSEGKTNGQVRKSQSDMIMENTWWEDIQSRICYLYDYYHDDEPFQLRDLHPEESMVKTPIDAKYIVSSYQTMDKDQVTYHLQLRPSQKCNVDYYGEVFGDKYGSIFPLGLYIDIPDNNGVFNRWMIVEKADYYAPQFSTYQILPCDYIFQWIHDGNKYQMPGILRSQNSYNSGIWSDYMITSPEDQQKFIVPLNDITEQLWYNQRMIIDAKVSTEPRAWEISKVNRISPNGLCRITLAQDKFDQHRDFIERDDKNQIIGMWADYLNEVIKPSDPEEILPNNLYSKISYTGMSPQIKVGGGYKTLTVDFYQDNELADFKVGTWSFTIKQNPYTDNETILPADEYISVLMSQDSTVLNENQIKVKFTGDLSWVNNILVVTYTSDDGIVGNIELEIVGL